MAASTGPSEYLACSKYLIRAAAAAKSLQSCPTLCDAIDGSPPGSPIPGILYLLAVMISVAMNVYVQAFTWTHFRFSGT